MDTSFIPSIANLRVFNYGATQRSPADEELLRQTRIGVEEIREARRRQQSLESAAREYEHLHDYALGHTLRQLYRPRDAVIAGARGSRLHRAARMLSMADRPSQERLSALAEDETQFAVNPAVPRLFSGPPLDVARAELVEGLERSEEEEDRQRAQRFREDIAQRKKHVKKVASRKEEEALEESLQEHFRIRGIVTQLDEAHKGAGYDMFDLQQAQSEI